MLHVILLNYLSLGIWEADSEMFNGNYLLCVYPVMIIVSYSKPCILSFYKVKHNSYIDMAHHR